MARTEIAAANALGAARAETDSTMLARAFVETADYRALIRTDDFNFVVGRRGTGKSALFRKIREFYQGDRLNMVIADTPREHHTLEMGHILRNASEDYKLVRAISRLSWRVSVLTSIASRLLDHYKIVKTEGFDFLSGYRAAHGVLLKRSVSEACVEVLRAVTAGGDVDLSMPSRIAGQFDVERLQDSIVNSLEELGQRAVVFFDGLDEGWEPTACSTAILGGLAACVSTFAEASDRLYGVIFVRDNMFRALAHFDTDFSRHIEGNTLRLHWGEQSLLNLVASRLRVFLDIPKLESDIKVWNRFAHHQLRDREGFRFCLHQTLYRPRDILVLLNKAYVIAAKQGRSEIVGEDIEATATSISQDRLDDLLKEYRVVLPGLRLFVRVFENRRPFGTVGEFLVYLEDAISNSTFESPDESDFALLGSGRQIFLALYAVGFIGLRDSSKGTYSFCYDGSLTEAEDFRDDQEAVVHPCYWRALGFDEAAPEVVAITIGDEYGDQPASEEPKEIRSKRLGQIVEELPSLPLGPEGSNEFEKWVHRALSILFGGKLSNFQLKPNQGAIQRRDIVATNMAERGFWRRILEDYKARQVVFEVKNYQELNEDDFRQALSYSGRDYGKFVMFITRAEGEAVSEKEKGWIRELYNHSGVLALIVPASLLRRCLSKLRAPKHDYTEDALSKRMDTFVRSYLSLSHSTAFRKRKK